ncbi:ATP-binding protein [Natronomonas sp. EA1]|uniref:ATP-binding protein n=1 Tax=Natronomonas sp. EA1 TaxID=3421655 RepID=UPI003EBC0CB1
MGDSETIRVGEESEGEHAGRAVELPVVELLTGRGFVTGKSGSGKSNTASVIAEKLLDGGYGLLIVDIDGEYYGLKEEYEILHVGDDEECDLRVGVEHAEKLATLALEQNVPIILDVSSFLDERNAKELLTEVAKHLFAKEKKLKQPFLMLVEEVHEWIPEGGGLDECGRMLIKVGKRGRKHGLGITGISQRPADVKKDFITQCDWLTWHRLTWGNDTKVVGRILGSDYESAVEGMNDGEAFLMTDWSEDIRRVQFERKRTFDAGATPGLDDFERPELKSVSADLMGELETISESQEQRESRVQQLELELKNKQQRIEELEEELEEARDLSRMAEQFSRAMMAHATGRAFREDITGYQSQLEEHLPADALDAPDFARDAPAMNGGSAESEAQADGGTSAASDASSGVDYGATEAPDPDALVADDFGAERQAEAAKRIKDRRKDSTENEGTEEPPASFDPLPSDHGVSPDQRALVKRLRTEIVKLDAITQGMLAFYREYGPATPMDAHVVAGGDATRTEAYRRNGLLRELGLIQHVARGEYTSSITERIDEAHENRLEPETLDAAVAAVVEVLPPAKPPESAEDWPEP